MKSKAPEALALTGLCLLFFSLCVLGLSAWILLSREAYWLNTVSGQSLAGLLAACLCFSGALAGWFKKQGQNTRYRSLWMLAVAALPVLLSGNLLLQGQIQQELSQRLTAVQQEQQAHARRLYARPPLQAAAEIKANGADTYWHMLGSSGTGSLLAERDTERLQHLAKDVSERDFRALTSPSWASGTDYTPWVQALQRAAAHRYFEDTQTATGAEQLIDGQRSQLLGKMLLGEALMACRQQRPQAGLSLALDALRLGQDIQPSRGSLIEALVGLKIKEQVYQHWALLLNSCPVGAADLAGLLQQMQRFQAAEAPLARAVLYETLSWNDHLANLADSSAAERFSTHWQITGSRFRAVLLSLFHPLVILSALEESQQLAQQLTAVMALPDPKRPLAQQSLLETLEQTVSDQPLLGVLLPNFGGVWGRELQDRSDGRAALLALALQAYRIKHGAYPETLQQLSPELLSELPADPWSGQVFQYQRLGAAHYLFYGLGPTQRGGQGPNRFDPHNQSCAPESVSNKTNWVYASQLLAATTAPCTGLSTSGP